MTSIDDATGPVRSIRRERRVPISEPSAAPTAMQLRDRYSHFMLTVARSATVAAAAVLPFSTPATNVFFGIAFLAWLLSGQLWPMIGAAARHPVARGAVVLLIFVMAGTAWSSASWVESAEVISKYRKLLLLVMLLPLLDSAVWRRAVLVAFFGSVAVLLVLSVGIYVGVPGLPAADPAQGAVFRRNHITHGLLMALLTLAAGIVAATARAAWIRWLAGTLAIAAVANALLMTHARTGYVIFGVLLIFAALYRYRAKGVAVAMFVVVAAGAASYQWVPAVQQRIDAMAVEARGFGQGDVVTPTGIRLHYLQRAAEIVGDHPLIGAGTGAWPVEYERRSASDPAPLRDVSGMGNPHSEILLIAVQWGALGVLLYVAALTALLIAAGRLPMRRAWLARGTVAVFAVGSVFNSFFWDATEGHVLILLIGALYGGRWPPDQSDF